MYDIVFLSRLIPRQMDTQVRSKMARTMDDAANAWQYHIIGGLEENLGSPVKLLNYLPVKSYPANYRDAFVGRTVFSHADGAEDVNLPFCNIKYIKRLFQGGSLYREMRKWAVQDNGKPKILIAYTLYPEFLKAIELAKQLNPGIKAYAIVLDLPEYSVLTNRQNAYTKLYLSWSKRRAEKGISLPDGFILLTQQMADALRICQPYRIIEGICTRHFPPAARQQDGLKRIFYAGTLHQRFGVVHLLDAFRKISGDEYRLVLCGCGDSEERIRQAAMADPRIDFRGQLRRDQVLELMLQADVIVNPRGNNEEFTKYSFPSKNIEALSSGIPFVGYKLDGIGDEYDAYIRYPADDSPQALAAALVQACTDHSAADRAEAAREWVLEYKNPKVQAAKLLELIEGTL